ncbi:hypothetical protein J1N35_022213 [Gossypium stocksii]|uniref:Uncharacterized protein n=1 Tax=Gossypium stocksii TaxID=47602 RepID=A0A9D3VHQ3_9ROSI|nr:hypothetical protein J1N35_022213 [Gossypium stocksii]
MELHCSVNHMLPNSKMVAQVKMGSNAEAAAFLNLFVKKPWKMTVVSITPSLLPLRFLPTNPLFLQLQNNTVEVSFITPFLSSRKRVSHQYKSLSFVPLDNFVLEDGGGAGDGD